MKYQKDKSNWSYANNTYKETLGLYPENNQRQAIWLLIIGSSAVV